MDITQYRKFWFYFSSGYFFVNGFGGIVDVEGDPGFNRWQKIISWIIAALICGVVSIFGLYLAVHVIDAPVSWFRGLPASESAVMRTKMSKHDKPLTIYQFYDVQHKYRDWVELNKQEHAELDAMNGELKNG